MNKKIGEMLLQFSMTWKPDYEEGEYKELTGKYNEIHNKLSSVLTSNLLLELDEFICHKAAYEGNIAYEQGFKDGANLIIDLKN